MKTIELRKKIIEEKYLDGNCEHWEWDSDDHVTVYGNLHVDKNFKIEDFPVNLEVFGKILRTYNYDNYVTRIQ